METSRLTLDGTAEPVSRDQILRHARGHGNIHFPCSADHEQDWQPYPVDPYSAKSWSMVIPVKATPVTGTILRTAGPVPADSGQGTPSVRKCVAR